MKKVETNWFKSQIWWEGLISILFIVQWFHWGYKWNGAILKLCHKSNERNQAVGVILMGTLTTLFWRSSSYKIAFD